MSRHEIFLSRAQHDAILTAYPELIAKAFDRVGKPGVRWSVAGVFLQTRTLRGPVLDALREAKEEAITALSAQ